MSEPNETNRVATARISPLRRLSPLWLIPIVTLIVAAVMVVEAWRTQGPLITIQFDNASGIEAGVTRIRVRDVEIGQVEGISLNDSLDKVEVTARINQQYRDKLVEDSRFWVVQPTISLSGVSGLNTLISGQYIRFSPGTSDRFTTEFVGLEQAPLTPIGTPGLHVTLVTDGDFSFARGDNIQYQGMNVGKIEDIRVDLQVGKIYYDAFIEAPFHELITNETRFWNTSGVRAELTNEGFEVEIGTLDSILLGGISFTTPAGSVANPPDPQTEFYVFSSQGAIDEVQYQYAVNYWLMVRDSVSGLSVNSRVMYRGIQIGRVTSTHNIPPGSNLLDRDLELPVLIEINPGRLGLPDTLEGVSRATEEINRWIGQGLLATIRPQNLLVGQQQIELRYSEDGEAQQLAYFNDLPIIPSGSDTIDEFADSVQELIAKINNLPLESLLTDVDTLALDMSATLDQIRQLLVRGEEMLTDDRGTALVEQLNSSLAALQTLAESFSADSRTNQQMQQTLQSITDTMTEFKPLLEELRNKPNSLVFPAAQTPEVEPTRKQP